MKINTKFLPLFVVVLFVTNSIAFGMSRGDFVPLKKPAGPCILCLSGITDTSDVSLKGAVPSWITGRCGDKFHTHCLFRFKELQSRSETPSCDCPHCGDVDSMEDAFDTFDRLTPSPISVSDGYPDLILATKNKLPDVVDELISKAIKDLSPDLFVQFINAKTIKGRTALHCAVMNGSFYIAKALIGAGANITIKDTRGFTARDIAIENHDDGIIELLSPRSNRTLLYSPINLN